MNFRTSSGTYRGTLYGTGIPQQCYYGLADQMTFTWTNPPKDWNHPPILASLNDVRSEVRCTPAIVVKQPGSPYYNTSGSNPDGAKGDTPIIIDVEDDGYELTAASYGVQFDIRNDAHPVLIAWTQPGADDAFLALDRNGNDVIDSGAELFGNHTPIGSGVAAHGFAALAELDGNGDRVLDAHDAVWTSLLLRTDRNHDGRSSPDELQPLATTRISELRIDHQEIGKRDRWGNGFHYVAEYRDLAGRDHRYFDVVLRTIE